MTPADRLRSLVKEATSEQIETWLTNVRQGIYMPEVAGIVPEFVSVSLARIGEYAALAPQIAELVADMAEVLAAIQTHTRFSEMPDGELRFMQVATALASFAALAQSEDTG